MTYVSGFITPVESGRQEEYLASARTAWELMKAYVAIEIAENWGDAVPAGKQTDMRRAVDLQDGETVVFSWILWPDKSTSDRCEEAMRTDERFRALDMPFDGKRMIFGGFATIFAAKV